MARTPGRGLCPSLHCSLAAVLLGWAGLPAPVRAQASTRATGLLPLQLCPERRPIPLPLCRRLNHTNTHAATYQILVSFPCHPLCPPSSIFLPACSSKKTKQNKKTTSSAKKAISWVSFTPTFGNRRRVLENRVAKVNGHLLRLHGESLHGAAPQPPGWIQNLPEVGTPFSSSRLCGRPDRLGSTGRGSPGTYPLLLCGHEGLEARSHPEAQLLDEGRFRLTVDLNFHPCFKRRLL